MLKKMLVASDCSISGVSRRMLVASAYVQRNAVAFACPKRLGPYGHVVVSVSLLQNK